MGRNRTKRQNQRRIDAIKRELDENDKLARSVRNRFAAAFALFCIVLYAVINILPDSVTRPIDEHTAAMFGLVLHAAGISASVNGDIVSEGPLSFRIIPECTSLFTSCLFLCFVLFFPSQVRQKIAGLAVAVPALYLANLARLTVTFVVSRHDPGLFEMFHTYLGQVFTIILVVVACLLWLKWIDEKTPDESVFMNMALFLTRLAIAGGCLFLVWMKANHWYMWLVDCLTAFGFSLFGYHIKLALGHTLYYETFSIVSFASLILAARKMELLLKIKILAAGMAFLFITHLLHRSNNALMAYFNFTSAVPIDLTLLAVGQYILPVLFLVYYRCRAGYGEAVSN